ncbi:hypothetical protein [Nesterenkonia halobia]|uniref:hypothetical protein n=1 Tax=Nesterenkonia halobia TaxID=37922 RepID=UPI0031D1A16C
MQREPGQREGAPEAAARGGAAPDDRTVGVDGHLHVRREDGDQERRRGTSREAARRGVQHPDRAGQLRGPGEVHQRSPVREAAGDDRLEDLWAHDVQRAGDEEGGSHGSSSA